MDKILDNSDTSIWILEIQKWIDVNEDTWEFPQFKEETKIELLSKLLHLLNEKKDDEDTNDIFSIMKMIRLLAREKVGLRPLTEKSIMELFVDLTFSNNNNKIEEEGLKCLLNLIAKSPEEQIENFISLQGIPKLSQTLHQIVNQNISDISSGSLIAICRIFFQLALPQNFEQLEKNDSHYVVLDSLLSLATTDTIETSYRFKTIFEQKEEDFFPSDAQFDAQYQKQLDESDFSTNYKEVSIDFSESNIYNVPIILKDILNTIFNMTMNYGNLTNSPNGPKQNINQKEKEMFQKLIPLFHTILNFPLSVQQNPENQQQNFEQDIVFSLKNSVINCLINFPQELYEDLFSLNECIKNNLFDVLELKLQYLNKHKEEKTEEGILTPVLMCLTLFAEHYKPIRLVFKKRLFNESWSGQDSITMEGNQIVNDNPNSIANILLGFMTTFHVALKHYVNEFLFFICDEDAQELLRLCGIGRSAGLLQSRGLLGLLAQQAAQAKQREQQEKVEELQDDDDDDDDDDDTDTDDIDESKLPSMEDIEKIKRLQELGIINMVQQ